MSNINNASQDTHPAKRKPGRPVGTGRYKPGKVIVNTDYLDSHPEKLLALMKEGYLDCEVFAAFEICKDVFYEWLRKYEDFKKAHEIGLGHCQAFYARHAREAMLRGDDRGAKYFIMIMNNKFGWGKEDNRQVTNNTQINIKGNMQVLQAKSSEELLDLLRADVDYLTNNQVIDVELIDHTPNADQLNEQE